MGTMKRKDLVKLIPPRRAKWWLGFTDIKQALQAGEEQDMFLIKDIAVHGCEGGVPGLTYYVDTTDFFDCFEHDVWKYVREAAEASGSSTNHICVHTQYQPPTDPDVPCPPLRGGGWRNVHHTTFRK